MSRGISQESEFPRPCNNIITYSFQIKCFHSRIICGVGIVLFYFLGDYLNELKKYDSLCLVCLPFFLSIHSGVSAQNSLIGYLDQKSKAQVDL